ncbi:MAG: aspartate aminotransferase family protein [Myxococcota bacterium]|nr:aspartate aminotransferase family protein [Myxococcota bacterium]
MAQRLSAVEGQGVTSLSPAPIFWSRAQGSNVWDVDGNQYLDLSAAFGVANAGHAHPQVVEAFHQQAEKLLHGLGDVHPSDIRLALLEELVARFPGHGEAKAVLGSSGSDAVETALKTALLASGKPGILAFEGAYHGVTLGTLDVTWRRDFRDPFRARIPKQTRFARFGDLTHTQEVADQAAADGFEIGAVLVEPIQGRGGDRIPPRGFLSGLRALCDERGWLLIVDEIFTGFGRTGRLWASDHESVIPDLLCAGKGLASGLPLSACLGRAEVMDAWPRPNPEAIHTQTFLGHPANCAAALASLKILDGEDELKRVTALGTDARSRLEHGLQSLSSVQDVRGLGLLIAIEFNESADAEALATRALERGLILLQSAENGCVVSITPPFCISEEALTHAVKTLVQIAGELEEKRSS